MCIPPLKNRADYLYSSYISFELTRSDRPRDPTKDPRVTGPPPEGERQHRKVKKYRDKFDPRVTAKYDIKALIGRGNFSKDVGLSSDPLVYHFLFVSEFDFQVLRQHVGQWDPPVPIYYLDIPLQNKK
jgi:hypothetical protein